MPFLGTRFLSPVGRLVQGDAFEPQTKDQQGAPRVVKSGPNAGQPSPQWFVAVAFPKTSPDPAYNAQVADMLAYVDGASREAWPRLFPNPAGPCILPTFANKVIDGDGYDTTGKSNAGKPGMAGCWVFRFSSGYAPRAFHIGHYGPGEQIHDPKVLRCGYYVRVGGSSASNNVETKPGIYLNFDMIELVEVGPEIIQGPDAAAVFGATPVVLPPGVQAGGYRAAAAPPTTAPPPTTAAPIAPPYGGYMAPPSAAPAAPIAPPPPLLQSGPVMLAGAGGTYEQFRAAGWSDEQLVAHGKMLAPAHTPA